MTEATEKRSYRHAQCSYCGKQARFSIGVFVPLEEIKDGGWWDEREVYGGTLWRCPEHPFEDDAP